MHAMCSVLFRNRRRVNCIKKLCEKKTSDNLSAYTYIKGIRKGRWPVQNGIPCSKEMSFFSEINVICQKDVQIALVEPHLMELRSQCFGIHESLMRFGNSSYQSPESLPGKSMENGQGILLEPHLMELRTQCSGIHDSLMRLGKLQH